jgi:DNA-binding MarR family transcriptional regulator
VATKKANSHHTLGPQGIGYRIKVLSQLLHRLLQGRLDPFDLTVFHWLVLNLLWKEDGLAVSDIGDKLQQVGGTMTGVIDRMEERKLIFRERDTEDRRVWRIWLTPKGKDLGKTLPLEVTKNRERLYAGIPQADFDTFNRVLQQLTDNATKMSKS